MAARASSLVRLLSATASEMVSRHAPDGAFRWASPASRRVLGRAPARLTGRTLAQLAAPADRDAVAALFRRVAATGAAAKASYRLAGRGGERWCETTVRPGARRGRRLLEVEASTRDVTEFKRLERVLETIASEWRATVDSTQDVIVMLDPRARVVRANRATTRFLDRPFPELLGADVRKLLGLGRAPLFRLADLGRGRRHREAETYLPARRIWIRYSLDPILDAGGALTGAVLVVRDISERKRAERQLRLSFQRLRQLSAHLQVVREEERATMSREIHDELGHTLTGLKMEIVWLASRLGAEPPELAQRARSMTALIDATIATTRRLATALRPGILDDLGLVPALEWQLGDFAQRAGLAARIAAMPAAEEPALARLDRDRATAVFRIFQEALTNVARHAAARRVTVGMSCDHRALLLEVRDDGRGFDPRSAGKRRSLGLLGMQERAAAFGGAVQLRSAPGEGTTVTVRIPLP